MAKQNVKIYEIGDVFFSGCMGFKGNVAINEATQIYRYMRYEHFLDMIEGNKNVLSHFTKWDDPYEAFVFREENKFNEFRKYYGQSWMLDGKESDHFWRTYCPNKNGVRIMTTVGKLLNFLKEGLSGDGLSCKLYLGKVLYCGKNKIEESIGEDDDSIIKSLFVKRSEFKFEAEFRMVAKIELQDERKIPEIKGGFLLGDIADDFISEVLIDPRMNRKTAEEIICRSKNAGFLSDITQSKLYEWPSMIKVFDRVYKVNNQYQEFWQSFVKLYSNKRAFQLSCVPHSNWWRSKTKIDGGWFALTAMKTKAELVLYLDTGNKESTWALYEKMKARKDDIEKEFEKSLEWCDMKDCRAKRIVYRLPGLKFNQSKNNVDLITAFCKKMPKFESVLKKYLKEVES